MSVFSNIKQHYIDKRMQKIDAINEEMDNIVYDIYFETYAKTRVYKFGYKRITTEECSELKNEVEYNWDVGLSTFIDIAAKKDFRSIILKSGLIPSVGAVVGVALRAAKVIPDNLIVNSVIYGLCGAGLAFCAKTIYDRKNKCCMPSNLDLVDKALNIPAEEFYKKAEMQFNKQKNTLFINMDQGEIDNQEHMMYF